MRRLSVLVFLGCVLFSTPMPLAFAQAAPQPLSMTDQQKAEMARRVRQEFLHAWDGYRQYAWGHDALKPLSKKPHDWYAHSLLMTPVDGLDTMILMGLTPQADEARKLIDTQLNFDQDMYVKDFEITIRMMGGLLSSYQLTGDKRLLELADDLGRRMLPMFNSPTGMPYEYVNLHTGAVRGPNSNPAEVGSLLLEYGTLARLTGKQVYYDKAKRAVVAMYKRQSKIGLVGLGINVETGKWTDRTAGIMGGIDSYYEYLLKCAILFNDKDCERMWNESAAAINKYLADQRPNGLWYGQANMGTGKRIATYYGALDAFFPAVLALGGDRERAAKLQDSSYLMWNLAGIEPDSLNYAAMQIKDANYPLRPEIIESAYYLYHYTHDPKYLVMGQTFFDSLMKYCRNDVGFAALSDVRTKQKADSMESFFFAETMKYLYLLFAPPSTLDFDSIVFNTEAHPLKRNFTAASN
ncbi:glycoside hydrolase family 47 protein [Alloacidobacterium dinghuense]|uniref:Glycoside hydrolase family 47 protein n=1 Tax=Alloacidobacterium dinghuense TaxID=2763107 RepID=A0A7G8BER7_9BACT|nr:glycoside hydrolase family 47 protein [Alloacidobacterium dinghuense]QNI31037.1 glycoside hydrolase family 47 protein [Alloacidobacterium dinghuense]